MCTETQRAELATLRAARTALLSGTMRTKARYSDKEVTYAPADMAELKEAIRELEACCPDDQSAGRARRHGFVRPRL